LIFGMQTKFITSTCLLNIQQSKFKEELRPL